MMAMAMNENEQQRFVKKMCGAICAPILDPPRMVSYQFDDSLRVADVSLSYIRIWMRI
jgi:hypothetical protein